MEDTAALPYSSLRRVFAAARRRRVHGQRARPLRGRHARRRDAQLHRQDEHRRQRQRHAPQRGDAADGASGERAFEQQVADAIARGEKPPERAQGMGIYGRPREGADVFDINAGE
jgi:hypothetical protein